MQPAGKFARTGAVLSALFGGRLREQFYSDVFHYGAGPDAASHVAVGYIALATAIGWLVGALTIVLAYPGNVESTALSLAAAAASWLLFRQVRRRKATLPWLDVLVPFYFVSIVVAQSHHAGHVAPMVNSLPIAAGIVAIYQRPHMRPVSLAFAIMTVTYCVFSSLGFFGTAPGGFESSRSMLVFVALLGTTLGLAGLAWMSILSRDYNIDQLRIANDTIMDSATRVRNALEAARVALWDVPNADVRLFNVSDSFQSITGYTAEEFNGIFGNVDKFVHPDDVKKLQGAFAIGRERMSRIRIDFRLLTRQRGYRWFSVRARYVRNADGTPRLSGSLQDINVVKAAEEALRASRDQARAANKAKSDFIGVMSHEVRTPLNAILGSVEVLKRGRHSSESAEMIGLIDDAGRGLLAIVNDLLDVSRIDAGKMEFAPVPLDLNAAVTRTVEFWGPQAREKGLTLTIDCDAAASLPLLMLDAGRVRQIVGNLLSNAIKFTDSGSVKTTVSTSANASGGVAIAIDVIDTGPGVPAAVAEAIFAPFEQAPGDASRGGAGLGLFISRRLARMMGGDLTLEPVHAGAHFRLTLNAALAGPGATAQAQPAAVDISPMLGRRVLCVDDNDKNRRIAELLLGKLGFEVTLCASGGEALDICVMQSFDLILMDIVMPEMDGLETLRRLRDDADSLNRATPAIALTAKLSPEDIEAYKDTGFEGIAAKPINVSQLAGEFARIFAVA